MRDKHAFLWGCANMVRDIPDNRRDQFLEEFLSEHDATWGNEYDQYYGDSQWRRFLRDVRAKLQLEG